MSVLLWNLFLFSNSNHRFIFRKLSAGKKLLLQVSYGIVARILSRIIYSYLLVSNIQQLLFFPAGVPVDDRNWPPFFPIIHHDIANEIPIHAQKLQYLAFASWLGLYLVPYLSKA